MSPTRKGQGKAVMLNLNSEKTIDCLASILASGICQLGRVFLCSLFTLWSHLAFAEWPEFPVPNKAKVIIVGEEMAVNGLPTRIWEISSAQSPKEILSYYRQKWKSPVVPDGPGFIEEEAGGWQVISRSEDPYLYTVQVVESSMGSSKGFLAVSRPMELVGYQADGFAKPAGSEILSDVVSDDAGKRGRVIQFKNSQSIEANYNFYRNRYLADGWAELSELPADRNKALLLMNKGSGEISIVFNRFENESYGVLVESYD